LTGSEVTEFLNFRSSFVDSIKGEMIFEGEKNLCQCNFLLQFGKEEFNFKGKVKKLNFNLMGVRFS
jgi:hypothetical protein